MKIAVAGSGISGLSCAWRLARAGMDVTLFEAGDYFGGHTHTVDVTLDGVTHGVDTGFLVFNHRTYPQLVALLAELNVDTAASDMGFSVKLPVGGRMLEWAGGNLDQVFSQRRNLLNLPFLGMLSDIIRFNRAATALAAGLHMNQAPGGSLGDYLDAQGYGMPFRHWYLLPMAACIWSCPAEQMLAFPLQTFIRFCHNHGLLQVNGRPQWHTVAGGARHYVDKLLAAIPDRRLASPLLSVSRSGQGGARPVALHTAHGTEYYDELVLACHSDQSLALLSDARADERALLGSVRYQPNRAVLHTDASCLPAARRAWSAWNYQSSGLRAKGARGGTDSGKGMGAPQVCVHYLINKLQPLPFSQPVIVSLNPLDEPDPACVLGDFAYAHPVFDAAAIAGQALLPQVQGRGHTWFAGAWTGYGFHEDGLKSGLAVADALLLAARHSHAA